MEKQELIKFLKENLKVNVWCNYDSCGALVNVSITICNEEINESSDYLLAVH